MVETDLILNKLIKRREFMAFAGPLGFGALVSACGGKPTSAQERPTILPPARTGEPLASPTVLPSPIVVATEAPKPAFVVNSLSYLPRFEQAGFWKDPSISQEQIKEQLTRFQQILEKPNPRDNLKARIDVMSVLTAGYYARGRPKNQYDLIAEWIKAMETDLPDEFSRSFPSGRNEKIFDVLNEKPFR